MGDEATFSGMAEQPAAAHGAGASGPSAAAIGPNHVTIPLEQLQAFTNMQARLAQLESEQRSRELVVQQEQARMLAQKGEVENALRMVREQAEQQVQTERLRLAQIEDRAKRYALDGELSRALAACNLVPGGAEQLTRLWRDQFSVEAHGESFVVRTPTFQSVGEFVSQQLARDEYSHFMRARKPDGGGTGGYHPASQSTPSAPSGPAHAPQPRNLGEAVVLQMQTAQKSQGDPRANLGMPMGLKAAR